MPNHHHYTMSCTAPVFTERDMEKEERSLSIEERDEIYQDVAGTVAILRETPTMIRNAKDEVWRALNELPAEVKADYEKAVEDCPDLVRRETEPLRFLRCEGFDSWAAALRICKYWEMRRKIFGSERAFLPMTMNGKGTLHPDEAEKLELGALMALPKDRMGRAVLYLNQNPLDECESTRSLSLRLIFYVCCCAMGDELAQRHGLVMILDMRNKRVTKFDRHLVRNILESLRSCLPVRLRAWHFCFPAKKSPGMIVLPAGLWLMGDNIRRRARMHAGEPEELLRSLEQFHLAKSNLPPVLGGTFGMDDFYQWMHERRALEMGA